MPKTSAPVVVAQSQPKKSEDPAKPLPKKKREKKSEAQLQLIEPDNEWHGPFILPTQINGDPIPNYSQLLFKITIENFQIDIKGTNDRDSDDPDQYDYLNLILNAIDLKFAITKYGFSFQAGLGNLRLLDNIHQTAQKEPIEILSSTSSGKLIKLFFRQVDKEAPNFATLYNRIISNILFECNNIQLDCHRTAIIHFLNYGKGITDKLSVENENPMPRNSEIEVLSTESNSDSKKLETSAEAKKAFYLGISELNIEAKMNQLAWKMFDNDLRFGDMKIQELSVVYNLCGIRSDVKVQLKTIFINYDDFIPKSESFADLAAATSTPKSQMTKSKTKPTLKMNPAYKQIISCTAYQNTRNFIDFNLVNYDTSNLSNEVIGHLIIDILN